MIVRALVEGNSARATCRMTGATKGTVLKLLVDLGEACDAFLDRELRNLTCERVESDEIWAFSADHSQRSISGDWAGTNLRTHRGQCRLPKPRGGNDR